MKTSVKYIFYDAKCLYVKTIIGNWYQKEMYWFYFLTVLYNFFINDSIIYIDAHIDIYLGVKKSFESILLY